MFSIDWSAVSAVFTALSAGAVVIGVLGLSQNRQTRQQEFENSLAHEYRDILERLPVDALRGRDISILTHEERIKYLAVFYRYFDLCNYQIFLRSKRRLTDETWAEWKFGILANLNKPMFKAVFEEMEGDLTATDEFDELRSLRSNSTAFDQFSYPSWRNLWNQFSAVSPTPTNEIQQFSITPDTHE